MSKAFTRESDDSPERPTAMRRSSSLPPGAKNYFTSDGLERLRCELTELESNPPNDSPAVRQRIAEIQESLESAVEVPSLPPPWDQVLFGATVAVRNQRGEETAYRIVGVDETDIDHDWISWLSPLAKALLKSCVGDKVHFRSPEGEQALEIISIRYN